MLLLARDSCNTCAVVRSKSPTQHPSRADGAEEDVTVDQGMTGTVVAEAVVAVVDLTSEGAPSELAVLDARISVLSGILDAVSRIDVVNQAIQAAADRAGAVAALQAAPFGYSEDQAGAVVDLPMTCQTTGAAGLWAAEKARLLVQRAALVERQAEVTAFHWFG